MVQNAQFKSQFQHFWGILGVYKWYRLFHSIESAISECPKMGTFGDFGQKWFLFWIPHKTLCYQRHHTTPSIHSLCDSCCVGLFHLFSCSSENLKKGNLLDIEWATIYGAWKCKELLADLTILWNKSKSSSRPSRASLLSIKCVFWLLLSFFQRKC